MDNILGKIYIYVNLYFFGMVVLNIGYYFCFLYIYVFENGSKRLGCFLKFGLYNVNVFVLRGDFLDLKGFF